MEVCGLSKEEDAPKAWEGKLFTRGRRYFSVCLAKSSHKPTPPCNLPHVSTDLLLQIELWVPTFQLRGRRKNGRNSSAFKRNSHTVFSSFGEHVKAKTASIHLRHEKESSLALSGPKKTPCVFICCLHLICLFFLAQHQRGD